MSAGQLPVGGRDQDRQLTIDGRVRSYRVYVPASLGEHPPVLLVFHGGGGDGPGMEHISHLDTTAEQGRFLAVYPNGYQRSWADGRGTTPAAKAGIDDVGFVGELIDRLALDFGIDTERVFATGLSNGAIFSELLGCALSDRIAGIAPVAGPPTTADAPACVPVRLVSVLLIHGTDDPLVPYGGGEVRGGRGGQVISAAQALSLWSHLDSCTEPPDTGVLPDIARDGTQVSTQTFTACSQSAAVALYTITGGGHTWPGGEQYLAVRLIGRTSRQFDAGATLWQFFMDHQRSGG